MSSQMAFNKKQKIEAKYQHDKDKWYISNTEDVDNVEVQCIITSSDYMQGKGFSLYFYNARITKDISGLPLGFKIKIACFNHSLNLEKQKEYIIKHLKFSAKYQSFQYIDNFTFHYLVDPTPIKEGANILKLTQFF